MTDKFNIKDYLNYSISGLLWMLIFIMLQNKYSIFTSDEVCKIAQIRNVEIYIALVVLFGSYLLGNLFRFTEVFLIIITKVLYGDLYETALRNDRDGHINKNTMEKIKALGLFYVLFKRKPLCIGGKSSAIIEANLKRLNISNVSKKNQHIMCESFLDIRFSNLNFQRLKNLKNFYESISFPLFVITIWFSLCLLCNNTIDCMIKLVIIAISFFVLYKFVERYRFLKSNYIKNTYRYFVFLDTKGDL